MAPSGTEIDAINIGSDQKSAAGTELLVPATSQTVSNAVMRINVLVPFAILPLPRAWATSAYARQIPSDDDRWSPQDMSHLVKIRQWLGFEPSIVEGKGLV